MSHRYRKHYFMSFGLWPLFRIDVLVLPSIPREEMKGYMETHFAVRTIKGRYETGDPITRHMLALVVSRDGRRRLLYRGAWPK